MSRNSGDTVMAVSFAIVIFGCWGIVKMFGVPWGVAIDVIPGLVLWVALLVGTLYLGVIEEFWPIFLGTSIIVFNPILNYWAVGRVDSSLYIEPAWYGKEGWQWIIAIALTGSGYGVKAWWNNRYSY